jgi:hypothetical protein
MSFCGALDLVYGPTLKEVVTKGTTMVTPAAANPKTSAATTYAHFITASRL